MALPLFGITINLDAFQDGRIADQAKCCFKNAPASPTTVEEANVAFEENEPLMVHVLRGRSHASCAYIRAVSMSRSDRASSIDSASGEGSASSVWRLEKESWIDYLCLAVVALGELHELGMRHFDPDKNILDAISMIVGCPFREDLSRLIPGYPAIQRPCSLTFICS